MYPSYKYNYFSGDIIRLLVRGKDGFDRVRCVARVREFAEFVGFVGFFELARVCWSYRVC